MDKEQLKADLEQAAVTGTLITPKHDPANIGTVHPDDRSVISYELAAGTSLVDFIRSGDFEVEEFENTDPRHAPFVYTLTPTVSTFSVPASGVDAFSPVPTSALDTLIAVKGHRQGWHVFGESKSAIVRHETSGKWKNRRRL